jgi:GNAT superfamily N-acetyltransferase
MNDDLNFEKVNPDNFDVFFNFVKKLAEYEKQGCLNENVKNRLEKDAFSKNPRYEAYLARYNDEYIGYFILLDTYSTYQGLPTLYLEDLFVLDEYRGKGIGQKMFEFCVDKANNENYGRMEWCVYNWNKPAIGFYRKNKASPLDKTYYRLNREQIKEHKK